MTTPSTLCNEEFEIVRITPDLYDESEALFLKVFLNHENICLAALVKQSPVATAEITQMLRAVIVDGVSFAARHRTSGKIVAVCCNKILNPKKNITMDDFVERCTSRNFEAIGACLDRMENQFNVFKEWQVDCTFQIEFIAVDPAWGRRGLGLGLAQYSLEFARAMSKNTLSAELRAQLNPDICEERPEIATSVFTTVYTQKIGEKLGFTTLTSIPMTEFSFEGKTFAQRIAPEHKFSQYAAIRL